MQQHGTRSLLILPGALFLLAVAGLCPTAHARGAAAAAAGRANSFLPKARGAGRSSSQNKPLPPLRASRAATRRDGAEEEEEEEEDVLDRLLGARGGRSSGNYYGQQGGYGYDDGYDDGYSGEGEAGGYDDGYGGAYGRPQQPPPRQVGGHVRFRLDERKMFLSGHISFISHFTYLSNIHNSAAPPLRPGAPAGATAARAAAASAAWASA